MAAHSSILAWEIPWTESLACYSPQGRKESDTIKQLSLSLKWHYLCHGTQEHLKTLQAPRPRVSTNPMEAPPR